MYKGKFRRAFPERFSFLSNSFFYALTAGRRRRGIIKGRSSERSFFMPVFKVANMVNIKGTTVYMVRGDTVDLSIEIKDQDGTIYTPSGADVVRFALKKNYSDVEPLILKDCTSLRLLVEPDDTKALPFGVYVYDIEITKADGTVDTFISRAKWNILQEVH